MQVEFIFHIAILIMSVVVHEVSHGYAASLLGDPTARFEGRLTLNPLKHLDFVGSFIVPSISYMLGGFIFGWAKPVPYNPYNLRPGRFSEALVAIAGPASNIAIAIFFGLLLRVGVSSNPAFIQVTALVVFINIILAIFNMVPIPPLDGSKILFALFPERAYRFRGILERYGFFLVVVFVLFAWQVVAPLTLSIFRLITGMDL